MVDINGGYDQTAGTWVIHSALQAMSEAHAGQGTISGGIIIGAISGSGMKIDVSVWNGVSEGVNVSTSARADVVIPAADATNDRYDLIVFDVSEDGTSDEIGVIEGTADSSPNPGDKLATGDVILGIVKVAANVTDITNSDCRDCRAFLPSSSDIMVDSTGATAMSFIGSGDVTIGAGLTVTGDIQVVGDDIQNDSGDAIISMATGATGLTTFAGDIKVTGNDIQSSSATALTLSGSNVTVAGDIQINGSDIKASNGNTNITVTSSTLTAFAGDIQVKGNDITDSGGGSAITFDGSSNTTINGSTTVNGGVVPVSDGGPYLGSSGKRWAGFYLYGPMYYYNPTSGSGNDLELSGSIVYENTSTALDKENVIDLISDKSSILYNLRPVVFDYTVEASGNAEDDARINNTGFIAEEVELIDKELVTHKDGKPHGVKVKQMIPMLVKEIQLIRAELDTLKSL